MLFGEKDAAARAEELLVYCRRHKHKVALRRGEELETQRGYILKKEPLKKLSSGAITIADLSEKDFSCRTQGGRDWVPRANGSYHLHSAVTAS